MKLLFRNIFSRKIFQPLFETQLQLALKAMNIGDAHTISTSGETALLALLRKKISEQPGYI